MPFRNSGSLQTVFSSNAGSLYAIAPEGGESPFFRSFVFSSPSTRRLCSDPLVVGNAYRQALQAAAQALFSQNPFRKILGQASDEQLNVLHILRGGLSFGLLDALGQIGRSQARASFVTSERFFDSTKLSADGWGVHKDAYAEFSFAEKSILLVGDISASGTTFKHVLEKIFSFAELSTASASLIRRVMVITIGGKPSQDLLASFVPRFRRAFSDFEGIDLVYLEGQFDVADQKRPRFNGEPGTDLVPGSGILAPEFEADLEKNPWIALEACMVYDGGSRSFFPAKHFASLTEYALKVEAALEKGTSPLDLIADRWDGALSLSPAKQKELEDIVRARQWVKERLHKAADREHD